MIRSLLLATTVLMSGCAGLPLVGQQAVCVEIGHHWVERARECGVVATSNTGGCDSSLSLFASDPTDCFAAIAVLPCERLTVLPDECVRLFPEGPDGQ